MDERIQRLNEIAQQGDIDAFYNIIREDVKLLENIDEFPFVDTPLHISASAGHFPFSLEMMILKPSFVSKRNLDGYTPIYLALLNGHTKMVCQLLQHNPDLVRVKGRECMTPLHYAATKNDNLALLKKILSVCPNSITDVTTRNETALHIALNYNNLEAFKVLVQWLPRKWPYWRKILELKDVEGNTLLHIAVSKNQTQIVCQLLACGWNVNIKNLEGKTACDIADMLQGQNDVDNNELRDISNMLHRAACCARYLGPLKSSFHKIFQRGTIEPPLLLKNISDEKRSGLLVLVALLVTVTYQAVLSPPGGIWPDDQSNDIAPHTAGTAIGMRGWPFWLFLICNSVTFVLSNATIFLLAPISGEFRLMFWALTIFLWVCYFNSLIVITHAPVWTFYIVVSAMPFHILITACPVSAMRNIKHFWNRTFFCWWTRSKHNQPSGLLNCILKRNDGEKSQA